MEKDNKEKRELEDNRSIDVDNDIISLENGKKLSLIPARQMPLSKTQILTLLQRTPQSHIFTRPGKGGGTFEYVTGVYVKKVLNYVFGFNWDFEIVEHGREQDQVWVKGKLTVKDGKGSAVSKMQFGRADIKYRKGTKDMLDFGNDLKSATTDSLKKCASELGIASDVYGKNEFKELGADVIDKEKKASPVEKTVIHKEPKETVDYKAKLYAEVLKMAGKDKMTGQQVLDFINAKLGTKAKAINGQGHAQQLLAQLLIKRK